MCQRLPSVSSCLLLVLAGLALDCPHEFRRIGLDLSGASAQGAQEYQAKRCGGLGDHTYHILTVSWPPSPFHPDESEDVGVCLPTACFEEAGGSVQPEIIQVLRRHILEYRCRDGHPEMTFMWPLPEEEGKEAFQKWYDNIVFGRLEGNPLRLLSRQTVAECPSAVCASVAVIMLRDIDDQEGEGRQLASLNVLMQSCYDELLGDVNQLQLFGAHGFNLAMFDLLQAKVRKQQHANKPRSPHIDDGRLVWRDHYSGLYSPVDYSEQFDLQWKLALNGSAGFVDESSTRLDDCALNDMIQSTFGEREFLKGCTEKAREAHLKKERGIAPRNFMLLNVEEFRGANVLDVGCGFGRWTAMMKRLDANVTSIDASPHSVRSARRYNPDQTFQMSLWELQSLPGFKNGWDLVICWGVLQHTHNPLEAFKIVASAVKEGGVLFVQVYSDQSKAAYPYVHKLRGTFHKLKTTEERIEFLHKTHSAAGADIFDHLDGMLTFYNWVVHEETIRGWFLSNGFADYWKVWNYKYMGRKRRIARPVRDDAGHLLTDDLGESESKVNYYPVRM